MELAATLVLAGMLVAGALLWAREMRVAQREAHDLAVSTVERITAVLTGGTENKPLGDAEAQRIIQEAEAMWAEQMPSDEHVVPDVELDDDWFAADAQAVREGDIWAQNESLPQPPE